MIIALKLDVSKPKEVQELQDFLSKLGTETKNIEVTTQPPQRAVTKTRVTFTTAASGVPDVAEPEVSFVDLKKTLLAKVTADNQSLVKEYLSMLGANKLSDLDPAKYEDMHDFLSNL